ncbi:MAG: aminopeptidase P family protein [Clostridia bacterium]|nr:aminopeptidase P family protein [Clostridia bacterium]
MYDLSHVTLGAITETPESEFIMRRKKVDKILEEKGLEGMIFFNTSSIFYLTGSSLIQTERPMVYIYRAAGESALLVPRLELEHASAHVKNCKIYCYPEYPGERHPMEFLKDIVKELGLENATLGADGNGAPAVQGYKGPALTEIFPDMKLTFMPRMITEMKIYKSPFEIMLMKESARWGNLAHMLLQEYTKPGANEADVSARASAEATRIMLKTMGPCYKPTGYDSRGASAGYRGQIGPNSYFPHATMAALTFKPGDTLVTGAGASIQGYNSELERVMFVGEPSKEQEKFYNYAITAQKAAYAEIKPGKKCSDVDKAMMNFFKDNGLMKYWRHHTGHSIGTGGHEAPFFDVADDTLIVPGMCFTVEPGLYVEGLGGFRLSDTLVVTETGFELITYYPTEIEKMICW